MQTTDVIDSSIAADTTYRTASRWAVLGLFLINGTAIANFASRIPTITSALKLDEGSFGLVLTGSAIGVLSALFFAGGLIGRFGSRKVASIACVVVCIVLPLLGLMAHPLLLWLTLVAFGISVSTMDVSMNAQAVEIERRAGKPLMSSFHASFSIGGVIGAAIGAGMIKLGVAPFLHFAIVSIGFALLGLAATRGLVSIANETDDKMTQSSVFRLPPRSLWVLGMIACCAASSEGAMADWTGLYIQNVVRAPIYQVTFGFAAFSAMMTLGRILGDSLVQRIAPATLVRLGGTVASLGLLCAVLFPTLPVSLIGFAAVGAGLSIVVPLVFSSAGNIPGIPPGVGIAGVATIGYAGLLAGPPVIGLISKLTSLRIGMLFVALIIGSLIVTASALKRDAKTQ